MKRIEMSKAVGTFGVWRYQGGAAVWVVTAEVPGVDRYYRDGWCSLTRPDESNVWADDFHAESKTVRALLDCVAFDWAGPHPWSWQSQPVE